MHKHAITYLLQASSTTTQVKNVKNDFSPLERFTSPSPSKMLLRIPAIEKKINAQIRLRSLRQIFGNQVENLAMRSM